MNGEYEKAQQVLSALRQAEIAEPQTALPMLNALAGLVQSATGNDNIEIDEKRASAFLAICEVGKALHRGQPTSPLWTTAIDATELWMASARL